MTPLLEWIAQHSEWAYGTIFAVALTESLVFVGLIVPGALVLFAAGALVGAGSLDLWATLLWAFTGAVAGDGISYFLGRRYRGELQRLWPSARRSEALARATAHFLRHGGMSIFVGRFVGSLRPLIPAVAGALGMPAARFYTVNVLSAAAWAPAYVLPGVAIGASLGLAAAVATRLAVIIVLLVAIIWGSIWLVARSVVWLRPHAAVRLAQLETWARGATPSNRWSLRNMVAALFDPARSESRALLAFAAVLIAAAWLFFGILEDVLTKDPLVIADKIIYHVLQGLRTPFGDRIMIALSQLGDAAVTVPVIAAVLLWLLWKRAWRAAGYWLAAAAFGAVLTVALKAGFTLPRPVSLYEGARGFGFPSGHAAMSLVVFGFLAVLAGRELSARARVAVFSAAAVLVSLIAVSRLYLGAHWVSDVGGGLAFGAAWVALLSIAYVRHPAPTVSARRLLGVAAIAFIAGATIQSLHQYTADVARYAPRHERQAIARQDWLDRAWQILPAWHIDLEGKYEQPLTVQWAGSLEALRGVLTVRGWREAVPLAGRNLLLWLDTGRPAMELPLLPRVHDGRHETLGLIYAVEGQASERLVFRLWPTDIVVKETREPLWIGMVTRETIRRPLSWFNLPYDSTDFIEPRLALSRSVAGFPAQLVKRSDIASPDGSRKIVWDGGVLLARERD